MALWSADQDGMAIEVCLFVTHLSKAPQGNERGAMGSKSPPAYQKHCFCSIQHYHSVLRPLPPYSLWRWGVTCHVLDVSYETPDVTPCRTSPPMPICIHISRETPDLTPCHTSPPQGALVTTHNEQLTCREQSIPLRITLIMMQLTIALMMIILLMMMMMMMMMMMRPLVTITCRERSGPPCRLNKHFEI